jgi:hypothetical protein
MKSLISILESGILKSTNTGRSAIINKTISNFKNLKHIKSDAYLKDYIDIDGVITGEFVGKLIKINIDTTNTSIKSLKFTTLPITENDISSGYLDNIHSVWFNGKCCNISYSNCKLKDADEYIKEVGSLIYLSGCEIDNITSLPKNCKNLGFGTSFSKPCTVNGEIRDIELDTFSLYCIGQDNPLEINYKNINNVKINSSITLHQDNFIEIENRSIHKTMFNKLFKDKLNDLFDRNRFDETKFSILLKLYGCKRVVKNNSGDYQLRATSTIF